MKPHPEPDHIDEAASQWAARLEGGGMNANDHAAFSAWLNANSEHRQAFAPYQELTQRLDAHIDALLGAAVDSATQAQIAARKRRRVFAATLATAAAVVALAFVFTHRPLELETTTAERHMTTLDDGSQVELNAQTTLAVNFKRDERRVRLVSGEALFTVAKDVKRPFVVETSTGSVRVTGTVFNVRAANIEHSEVTVLEGTVRVLSSGDTTHEQSVTAGRQAAISTKTVTVRTLPEGAARDATAWRQGQVVFNDTPLSEAIERFSGYHARAIVVDANAADLRLGGRFSLDDLNGLLESIESVLPVQVSHQVGGDIRITAAEVPTK